MSDALESAGGRLQQHEPPQPAKNQVDPPLLNGRLTMDNFQEGEEEKKEELLVAASSAGNAFAEQVAEESPPADELLEHLFQPGDHVIRWEMLPIAWPIQIHGIVLETTESSVTLADFGLTAKPVDEHAAEKDLKDTPVQPFIDHPVSHKVEQAVLSAWERFRPKQGTKQRRQRITVQTITDPKELSRWKKVNYGSNLFGGGGGSDEDSSGSKSAAGKRPGAWLKKMTSSWNSNDGSSPRTPERKKGGDLTNSERTEEDGIAKQNASADDGSAMSTVVSDDGEARKPTTTWVKRMTSWSKNDGAPLLPERKLENIDDSATAAHSESNAEQFKSPEDGAEEQQADNKAWWRRMPHWNCERSLVGYAETPEKQSRVVDITADNSVGIQDCEADWSQRKMNPAMAKLIAEKSNEVTKPPEEMSNETCKQGKILPKADPPKLILARTRFLLEHGESVLPPYHVFNSNSECIAVFCTTGRWSTLQAAVFLHSSAIGNAKGAAALTLSAAAAVPFAAPVVGALGLAMVGMPWWILRDSKVKWEEATKDLTEQFWAQAENEVFVECIEQWSGVPKLD